MVGDGHEHHLGGQADVLEQRSTPLHACHRPVAGTGLHRPAVGDERMVEAGRHMGHDLVATVRATGEHHRGTA